MPTTTKPKSKKHLLASGHRACAGCGQLIAARTVIEAMGPNTVIANGTGCLEVTTSPYPESSWGVPWIHSLFENAAAVASGVRAALDSKGVKGKKTRVLAQGGDGGTFDIGFGLISGMWERGEDITYVCYDNEAYANTGMQASTATPWGSSTTTTPSGSGKSIDAIGSHLRKKDIVAIALAHRLNYVAQTTVGYLEDIKAKVKKAIETPGPSYIQIMVPCVPGWKFPPDQTLQIGKLAAQTGLYPLLEYENGELTNVMKVPTKTPKVDNYLKAQGRFKHLLENNKLAKEQIKYIQQIANDNIKKYGLK
ncbi:pyruvate ferredoxin oxidoreductase [Candidatus Parcubacteria bacterium]|nr:MAG: pyruvate ferredoxin oxidoreductase [Candidatus Parcubacteria bacterium]